MSFFKTISKKFDNTPRLNIKINNASPTAIETIAQAVASILTSYNSQPDNSFAIICIGTDRSTGDCLGPLVGTKLAEFEQNIFKIYGTLDEPVHAANLIESLDKVKANHPTPIIIAIDACLGNLNNIGNINLAEGPIKPGAGVNKELPPVGDYHITGIVNVGGFMEYFVLQNTRLSLVMKMADIITKGIIGGIAEYQRNDDRS